MCCHPRPSHKKTPIAQALGATRYVLLELVPRKGLNVTPNEVVYIGEGKREKIHHILGRLPLDKLTATAQSELKVVLLELVRKNEQRFVDFFNNAQPLTTRMHILELLHGVGKKHMWEIIEKREEKPFSSFVDMKARVKLMPDPEKAIVNRILAELGGNEKHRLFVDVTWVPRAPKPIVEKKVAKPEELEDLEEVEE